MKNGEIILCKGIKLDKGYENVLSYNETNMVTLCRNNKIAESTKYHILDPIRGEMDVSLPYSSCIYANYIAFRNPNVGNKWYFAFVNNVEYVNPATTRIYYKVDVFSTWYSEMNVGQAFIEREHVDDDTIGKHIVDEGLEIGDLVIHDKNCKLNNPENYVIVIGVTSVPYSIDQGLTRSRNYNGIFSGLTYLIPSSVADACKLIDAYEKTNMTDAIFEIFMYYDSLDIILSPEETWIYHEGEEDEFSFKLKQVRGSDSDTNQVGIATLTIPNDLNGYTPKNNKLFTYPYCFINASNNAGIVQQFKWELFRKVIDPESNRQFCSFDLESTICPGGSAKAIPMQDYAQYSTSGSVTSDDNYMYSIPLAKLPVCSWLSDTYINWITQGGINSTGIVDSVKAIGFSAVTGDYLGIAAGFIGIYDGVKKIFDMKNAPDIVKGNTNSGDVNFSYENDGGFSLYNMTLTYSYAKRIDDFFSRFGYKVNEIKTPNLNSRTKFNFIKVGGLDELISGDIPAADLDEINAIFRKGVTIFHDYSTFGNYTQTNSIVTP